jgi:methionyl-tRNA formyltransferase
MKKNLKNILYVSYREWANNAYHEIALDIDHITTTQDLLTYLDNNQNIEYIFFVGWSEIINNDILEKYSCFCVHPSMLPLYRGGSPIQNQIIDGVLDSGVTLFKMNQKLDAGPIVYQKYLSLRGDLNSIFNRITFITADLIRNFILQIEEGAELNMLIQNENNATLYKRRKPSESQITLDEIQKSTALQLYNKIRSLDDPYPNANIKCYDGSKLYIKKAEI